jgi:hypothetical protein
MVSSTRLGIEDKNHQKASEHATYDKQHVCGIILA